MSSLKRFQGKFPVICAGHIVPPQSYPWWHLGLGLFGLAALMILSAGIGSVKIPAAQVMWTVLAEVFWHDVEGIPEMGHTIIWEIRLPRIILAGLVGSALATAGATYQGLFRNPLADPYLIGVASGAGLGATIVLTSGIRPTLLGFDLLPLAAFVGGLSAVAAAYAIAKKAATIPLAGLILAGVVTGSLASAATSFLMIRADPDVKPLLSWLLGGFTGAHWQQVQTVLLYWVPCAAAISAYGRVLNLLQLREEEAAQLGVDVERTKFILIVLASLITAVAVSVSGLIGFVGLIAPHAVRLAWGHDHRFLLPMSMVVGAGFLIGADLIARTVFSPAELPVGVVTAFCGAPFFLYLLRRGDAHG